MSRRKRNGAKKPPLSLIDKTIYAIAYILAFGIFIGGFLLLNYCNSQLVESESDIAVNSYMLAFCTLIPILIIVFSIVMVVSLGLSKKQPIFGNKRFMPDPMKPTLKVYPLFSKDFRNSLNKKAKKRIKQFSVAFLIAMGIGAVVMFFGIFPRHTISKGDILTSYNSFNSATSSCHISECEVLEISVERNSRRRGSPSYNIKFELEDKGHKYSFSISDFEDMDEKTALEYLLYIKSYFPDGEYKIKNAKHVDRLIWYRDYNAEEAKLVYELFDVNE